MSEPIQVVIRIKPTNNATILSSTTKTVSLANKTFTFNSVLNESTSQWEVYKEIEPLVRTTLEGYNATLFVYGQTGNYYIDV